MNITTSILQGVPPLSSFLYLISLAGVVSVSPTEANNQNFIDILIEVLVMKLADAMVYG